MESQYLLRASSPSSPCSPCPPRRTVSGSAVFLVCLTGLTALPLLLLASPVRAQRFSLGTAQSFAGLAGQAVASTGFSVLNGDLGLSPNGPTSITGFPDGVVNGDVHAGDALALQAQNDLTTSYNVLAGLTPTQSLTGTDLGGLTLTPGVYKFASSAQLTGVLTLDNQGVSDALFVFQIGSTLTTASNASVVMLGGAAACNVFWQVGESATLGTGTRFSGSILADKSITLTTGADILSGRALARTAALTLDTNTITLGDCPPLTEAAGTFAPRITADATAAPEPGSLVLLLPVLGAVGIVVRRRRRG